MHSLRNFVSLFLQTIIRDRVLLGVIFAAFLLVLLVPVFSTFSMRQVQELAITLSLSFTSFVLFVLALLIGASSLWHDVDRRFTAALLSLPVSRSQYVLAKFVAIAVFLVISSVALAVASATVIKLSALRYPSNIPIHWQTLFLALGLDTLKYIFITACALSFSAISTSLFLPFFGTIAIYFVGNSSQEVYEYVTGPYGKDFDPLSVAVIKGLYYLLPNFAGFNLKVHAIYGLSVPWKGVIVTCGYWLVYTLLILCLTNWIFSRRELA